MILTVADAGLEGILASREHLIQLWPGVVDDITILIHVLRITPVSLAEALALGLITLLAPTPPATTEVALANNEAVLHALARREDGVLIRSPHTRTAEVAWLEVVDLTVAGRSYLGRTP